MIYEYKVVTLERQISNFLEKKLNEAAADGFRCVHYGDSPNGDWTIVFERPMADL